MSESDLPVQLDKLKITDSTTPPIKLMDNELPLGLNPFYKGGLIADCQCPILQLNATEIPSLNRRICERNCHKCRPRRRSESTLDDLKHTTLPTETSEATNCERSTPGVHRHAFKKSVASSRKSIMRESVLQALQQTLHVRNVTSPKISATIENKTVETTKPPLICTSLTPDGDDFNSRLNKISLSQHNSKKFTVMQAPIAKSRSLRNIENADGSSSKHNNKLFRNNTVTVNVENSNPTTTVARTNTTCSQQASSSASNVGDDVTIDELASYFDTLVHIPKKMSISAEMMYI